MKKSKLTQAKIKLYHALLEKIPEDLTNGEVDLGFILSADPDIQNILGETTTKVANEKVFCLADMNLCLKGTRSFDRNNILKRK